MKSISIILWLHDDNDDDTGDMKGDKIKLSTAMFKTETVQLLGAYDNGKERLQNVRMCKLMTVMYA
jgi:hypothetical protein